MSSILKLMTGKHHADPYLPGSDQKYAYEVMQEAGVACVPRMMFAQESHWHLFNFINAEVLALIAKVLNSGFEPEKDCRVFYKSHENQDELTPIMLTPRQQVDLMMHEITLLLEMVAEQSKLFPKLLKKLNELLPEACEDIELKVRLIPMRLTPTEHTNLQGIIINLQRLNRLVYY